MIDIAIDLGSTYTTIYRLGSGIVLREPTVVALQMTNSGNHIKCMGDEAKALDGKNDENTAIVYPVVEGCIKNVELTTKMLKSFVRKIAPYKIFPPKIHAIMLVPMGAGASEIQSFYQVSYGCGITNVDLVPNILACDEGCENNHGSQCHCIVNIGADKTEIGVIRDNTVISGYSVSVGGKTIDQAITYFLSENYNLKISNQYAENIKNNIGSLYEGDTSQMEITAYDEETMEQRNTILTSSELYEPIAMVVEMITKTISTVIKTNQPDVINELTGTGITLCGGASKLSGIAEYVKSKTNIDTFISDSNENTTILGAGKLLGDSVTLSKILSNN